MRERLPKEERRDQLLNLLILRYADAQSQSEFTAASLACEAGVSTVWFYYLVGGQFKKLRSRLPGRIPPSETLVARLKMEVAELSAKLKSLKAQYETSMKEKLGEAIRHIELLDNENRMLRERLAVLEKRFSSDKIVIYTGSQDGSATPPQNPV